MSNERDPSDALHVCSKCNEPIPEDETICADCRLDPVIEANRPKRGAKRVLERRSNDAKACPHGIVEVPFSSFCGECQRTNACVHEWTHHCKKCGFLSELDGITETERSSAIKAFENISKLTEHDSPIDQLATAEHAALVHFRGRALDKVMPVQVNAVSDGHKRLIEQAKRAVRSWEDDPSSSATENDINELFLRANSAVDAPSTPPEDWADGVDAAAGVVRAERAHAPDWARPILDNLTDRLEKLAENYPGRKTDYPKAGGK